jgi:predicted nucleic acid-binding protein
MQNGNALADTSALIEYFRGNPSFSLENLLF